MMVAAGFECAASVLLLTPTGYSNEDDAAAPWERPNGVRQLVSVEIWETDIQKKRVRTEGLGELQRTSASVGCLGVVT
jgi:hypothetical protein